MRGIAVALVVAAACGQEQAVRDVRSISVHRTPGKPLDLFDPARPAERIVAQREPEGFGLVVFVNVPRTGVRKLRGRRAVLTHEEWRGLLELVGKEGLLDWTPDPVAGVAADWGEAGLSVAAAKLHAPTWTRPLENAGPANALFKALTSLARKKLPDVKLYYLD